MKKIVITCVILFVLNLLNGEVSNPFLQQQAKEHILLLENQQPHIIFSSEDLIMDISENKTEIIYDNPNRNKKIRNSRNTLCRLHFDTDYPFFIIMNEKYIFDNSEANWITPNVAEISLPEATYNIFVSFHVNSNSKFVVRKM